MIHTLQTLLQDQVEIGVILGAHGLHGDMKIRPYTQDISNFKIGKQYTLYQRKQHKYFYARMIRVRPSGAKLIVSFEGYTLIEEAQRLMGFEIMTKIEELHPKQEGEYFFFEVLGCEVIDEQNRPLGTVVDIIETGASNVVVIKEDPQDEDTRECLIPYVKAYIIDADYDQKIIKMRRPRYTQ